MSKSSVTAAPKLPTSLPTKSAWAKGPPPIASASSSPRSQSPAPSAQTPTHSRRPSALSNIPYKDGVAMNANAKPSGQATIKFGSVSDKLPLSPPPSDASSTTRPEPRKAPIQSFGSIDATTTTTNGVSTPPASSASSSTSTASGTSTAATTPASTPAKPRVDVSALFRGSSSTNVSSPVTPSMSEIVSSPQMRSQTLSPQVHNLSLAPAGPAGPSPLSHSQQPPPGSQPPGQMYPHAPFVPQNMRQQSNVSMANAPRSPGFQRQMTNGVGPTGGRPPANVQPGPNNAGMASPRIGPQPHHQPIPQHQMQQQQQQQQHPMQPVSGVAPGMQPNMQPMPYPGWPGYYYYPPPGAEYQMYPQQWHHPMNHVPGAPQPTPVHPSNMPVSPRQQPAPLQQAPATPPNIPPPLPSARLNSGASSFVPGAQGRIRITDASGHEINFRRPTSTTASPSPPPISLEKSQSRRPPVRIESEEERKKRVAEEEAKQKAKTDAESKAKKEKEDAELKARKKEEEEKERARKEEEDRLRAEEEEKKKKAEEEERIRKEEEEKLKREEEKKAEEERARKAAEEERLKKEAEEAEKVKKEAEEKERLEREAEVERLRKETEEAEKRRREEEERKKQEERSKDEDSKSKTVAIDVPAKPSSAPEGNLDTVPPLSTSPESRKQRPIPGPLDLSSTNRSGIPPPLPSALATARHIQDLGQVSYPEGVASPRPDLNMNARDGKFRYDRDFLLQFMKVCVEKPDNLPNLEAIGLEPVDQNAMTRGGSGRRGGAMGPPSTTRSASIGLGINSGGSGFAKSSGFAMGQFSTPGKIPSTSEDRFMRSTSMGSGAGGLPFTGRPSPMIRTSSQGGAMPGGMGSKRTRSKRGEARNDSNRINSSGPSGLNYGQHMEPVAPLELSANRWVPMNNKKAGSDENSPEVIDRKVRALLNKLTLENFESISDQIIAWANKSEKEKDGRILIQVIRLVFEKATDEAKFSEMYAALCQKMMLQISPNISDESLDKPIRGGHLFRKYLLNRCQEDFERGWNATRVAAAAAAAKADEDLATKEANEKRAAKPGEEELYSDEYYVAQKAKRQGLGLVSLIGELFKLSMLTEKIMHGCIKKFLKDIDNPEEADIESLCTLLKIIGKSLDVDKANFHMNVYFERMGEISRKENISFRMKSMLLEVIELRQRKWVPRSTVQAAPTTIAQVHEAAARERAQKEREDMNRSMTMSRGGSRRGVDRGDVSVGPDGWAVAGGSGPVKTTTKAGDLSNFGKINKATPGSMSFGPSSVFSKKDSKRDSGSLSRTNSSSNMFHMLSQNPEIAAEVTQSTSSRGSRAPSRTASVDLSAAAVADIGVSRPKLNLLPRSKPTLDEASEKQEPSAGPSEANSDDESEKTGALSSSMSSEKANEQIEKDFKEFFEARNITEGESYFTSLPSEYHHLLVDKLVSFAVESKEPNAKLVSDLFARAVEKSLCSPASFEEGLNSTAEALEDIAIDAPKAFDLMAIVMKGAALDEERRTRIAGKSEDGDKLLALLAA